MYGSTPPGKLPPSLPWTMFHSLQSTIKVNPFVGSFENEALENEDRSTKHPNLENEAPIENQAPKNSKTKTPKLETGLSFINTRQCLANTAGIKHDNVRVLRASLTPFSNSFQTFCVSARAYLHTSKYGQFWSLHKHVCVLKKIAY